MLSRVKGEVGLWSGTGYWSSNENANPKVGKSMLVGDGGPWSVARVEFIEVVDAGDGKYRAIAKEVV